MKADDFKQGDEVRYIPHHARGDITHKDCENGIVSSQNGVNVFVKYAHPTGGWHLHAQATSPNDLVKT